MTKLNGFLNIYKQRGFSSAKLVSMARKILNIKKIGHTGTLDPEAEGVLPLAIGEATKLCNLLIDAQKGYEFVIQFGSRSSTGDVAGEIIETKESKITEFELNNILPKFIGEIIQIPSKYSAIKINGERAYKLARKGEDFEIPKRCIEIYSLEILEFNQSNQTAKLKCICSKGTYIRTLAEDIAFSLHNLGYVLELRRVKVGNFHIENSVTLTDEFFTDSEASKKLSKYILPVDFLLDDILVINITEENAKRVRFGQLIDLDFEDNDLAAVKYENILVAIGEIRAKKFNIKRVFNL